MGKKNLKDMPDDWKKRHRITGLPDGPDGWCRELGIANPDAPTPEQLQEAWKEIREIIIVGSMVKDIETAIHTILRSPETTESMIQILQRLKPLIEQANAEMRKAGEIVDANGLDQGDTMPDEEES